jgi:hypothetical protein
VICVDSSLSFSTVLSWRNSLGESINRDEMSTFSHHNTLDLCSRGASSYITGRWVWHFYYLFKFVHCHVGTFR